MERADSVLDTETRWTRRGLLQEAERVLGEADVSDARRNAEWMLGDVLGCSRAMLYAYPERVVGRERVETFSSMLSRRLKHEPVQYILGYTEFYGLRLRVTPDVLIPRPETEQVVEEALQLLKPYPAPRVLDVGTGSGCIPLAIKHERPDADVYACDVSQTALDVAAENAEAHRLSITFVQADVLARDFLKRVAGDLDLLVANPPYVPRSEADTLAPEVREHEPERALYADGDALRYYRAIVHHAPALLSPGGLLVFETHAEHGDAVRSLLTEADLEGVHLKEDLAGHPRIVSGRYPAG